MFQPATENASGGTKPVRASEIGEEEEVCFFSEDGLFSANVMEISDLN